MDTHTFNGPTFLLTNSYDVVEAAFGIGDPSIFKLDTAYFRGIVLPI